MKLIGGYYAGYSYVAIYEDFYGQEKTMEFVSYDEAYAYFYNLRKRTTFFGI